MKRVMYSTVITIQWWVVTLVDSSRSLTVCQQICTSVC